MQRLPKVVWRSPMMARGELYAYLINVVINEAYLVTPIRRGGPLERMLQWEVTRRRPRQREWLMAPHQWKWPLNAYPAKSQDPEADGGSDDNVSLAPTDPEAPPISVGCAQSIELTEAEKIAQVGATKAACVDVAGITLTEGGRTR